MHYVHAENLVRFAAHPDAKLNYSFLYAVIQVIQEL